MRCHALGLGGYVALTLAVMWPAVRHFGSRAATNSIDGAMFSWLWGAMPEALAAGENPYRTDRVFHPVGADLELTTSSPLIAATTWPVRATLGVAAQVNLLQILALFGTAVATYMLALRLCRNRLAAWLAGAAYALLPARLMHAAEGHLNLVLTGCIPLGLLLLLRLLDRPGRRRAIELGVALGATFLVDPQLAILLGLGVASWLLVRRDDARQLRRPLVTTGLTAVVVAAPLLIPMAIAMADGGIGNPDPTGSTLQYSSSPLSWVVPPTERLWIGRFGTLERLTPNWEGLAYPGLGMLGLAIAGVVLTDRDRRRGWVAISFVGFVLSLGPYPFVKDTMVRVPLPYFLLREVPGLEAMRVPGRFALLGALGVFMLAAMALADAARRLSSRRTGLLVLAVTGFTLVELQPREVLTRAESVPAAYEVLAEEGGSGAVLELPLKWSTSQEQFGFESTGQDFRFLLFQLAHDLPIVSGAVSRFPERDLEALVGEPVYRQVLALADQPGFEDRATFGSRDLQELGIEFVVYHRHDPVPAALAYLRSIDLTLLADDGSTIIWRVGG